MKNNILKYIIIFQFILFFSSCSFDGSRYKGPVSDHFNGEKFHNIDSSSSHSTWDLLRFLLFSSKGDWDDWWNEKPGPKPSERITADSLVVTFINHATFLIQTNGINILTDPVWSELVSPVPVIGMERHRPPGIRFEDLPPIDVVLVSHNHYDHLDLPTLKRLAEKGASRSIVPLGNLDLMKETGIPRADELDWWQSVRLSPDVTLTLVPAQHFSARTLWDRNKTLWGGFVVSGPSGNVYHAGDTGYGPHFREIARRFPSIRVALLPIAPYRPKQAKDTFSINYSTVHMGPAEAVQAHLDLGAQLSIAGHFQVFQLGADGFDDAVSELASTLKERDLNPGSFIIPIHGQAIEPDAPFEGVQRLVSLE